MEKYQRLISVCLLASIALSQSVFAETTPLTDLNDDDSPSEVIELTDSRPVLTWRPSDSSSIIVQAADGYQIQVDVSHLDVDGAEQDYVVIASRDEYNEQKESLIFTYTVSGAPRYLYNSNKVTANYIGQSDSDSFLIQFTRVGQAATTTPSPAPTTTTPKMPTASPQELSSLTVFLYGKAASDFGDSEVNTLKKAIASMGSDYCDGQGCPLNGTITKNNVRIADLEACSMQWENYKHCVKMTFRLPIIKVDYYKGNETWDGYQLNKKHLKEMWDGYSNQYLKDCGLGNYSEPDVDSIFTSWLILACLIIVLLALLVLVLRHVFGRINKRRRKLSDTISIIGQSNHRNSELAPHPLQEMPPLFSSDFIYHEHKKRFSDFNGYDELEQSVRPSSPSKVGNNGQEELVDDADA